MKNTLITVSELKRRLPIGTEITLKKFQVHKKDAPHKYLNVRRTVNIAQSNSFAMNGSWINWPKRSQFIPIDENTFAIQCSDTYMEYEIH